MQHSRFRIENARLLTLRENDSHQLPLGTVVVNDGKLVFVGANEQAPALEVNEQRLDAEGKLLTPGLIDCHTHLVWAGSRANEFGDRLRGKSYAEIAQQGGGIAATVRATREADKQQLFKLAERRAKQLLSEGVTTIEVKSGYGLDLENERKQLQVARQLSEQLPVTIQTTLLAAHAIPPEFKDNADGYIETVVNDILPTLAAESLVDAVDVFCESIGFDLAQTERVFKAASKLGLPIKLHAEQLSDMQGSALAASYQALSCDHLEYLSEASIAAMQKAGTAAVLLPGAFYFLRETKLPPIDLLRQYNIPIAIATDANPGSSPIHSLLLMLNMAATLFRLTPEECLRGVTINAARALGLKDRGQLVAGLRADLVLWDVTDPQELVYQYGVNPRLKSWTAGREI